MKQSVKLWQWVGFAVTSFLGTILHFLYEWLGKSPFIALFSGVNESTWEHMKLLFWPMFIFAVFQSFFFRGHEDFWCIKLRGILLGLALIPVLFYTYNGVIGKSPDFINIAIFFVSGAVAYVYETRKLNNEELSCAKKSSVAILCIIALLFVVFTFRTPRIALFKDPLTGGYGLNLIN